MAFFPIDIVIEHVFTFIALEVERPHQFHFHETHCSFVVNFWCGTFVTPRRENLLARRARLLEVISTVALLRLHIVCSSRALALVFKQWARETKLSLTLTLVRDRIQSVKIIWAFFAFVLFVTFLATALVGGTRPTLTVLLPFEFTFLAC